MSTLQTYNLKHPDASGDQITFTSGGDVNFDNGAVYLDSTNNRLGIGITSPAGVFHTKITTDRNLVFNTNSDGDARITALNDAVTANVNFALQGDNVILQTGGGAARLDSSGNVGIGATSVGSLLHVSGTSSTAFDATSFDSADYNFLKIENTTDDKSAGIRFQIGANGEAAITATEVSDGACDIVFQSRSGGVRSEKMRLKEDGALLVNTTSSPTGAISPKVVVNGNTLTKAGSATIDNTFTSITGATVGNETSVYLVTIRAIGDGNFYSTGTFILNSAAYSKTFTQLGSSSNHFGNGYLLAQLSSSSTTSASIQVRRSNAGSATCHVHMLRLM